MSQELKNLRRRLREERCPPAVLGRVRHQIALEQCRRRRLSVPAVIWAAGTLAAILAVTHLTGHLSSPPSEVPSVSKETHPGEHAPIHAASLEDERRAVRLQAGLALAYIGKALNRAGDESRDLILEASLPPLRQGLRTAREIISTSEHQLEPNH